MDLLNRKIAEARDLYNTYWESYTKGDLETFGSTLDDRFEMIGTSESERCHTKEDGIEFLKAQLHEVVGKAEMRNRQIDVVPLDNLVLINEQCDIYVLLDSEWNFYSKIRISTLLRETKEGWKVAQQHGSLPDMRVGEGETIALEKISKENLELRDAVKRRTAELENKNRELAIEAALEKVRAVAMGMKKPEDMLDVCRTISDQLQVFGVEKIRNVQIAIIDEYIGQYLCYQYFTPYDNTAVEKTEYLKSPVEHGMVKQMLASRDGFFIGNLSGQELEDFRSHRKEENHFPDPFLDKASELDYCFLSIGEGGLGLTLYQAMADEILTLFKRFHQVFSLAYQRFRDIQKAEAQAREAQIEVALERVRARAMAMHQSDEIKDVARELRVQLATLGSGELETCAVNLYEVNEEFMESWSALRPPDSKAEILEFHFQLPKKGIAIIEDILKVYHSGSEEFSIISEGAKGVQWMQKMKELVPEMYSAATVTPEFEHTGDVKAWWTGDFFSGGALLMITLDPPHQESRLLLKRFTKVFGLAFQRFQDLQKAEAHARESEIDLALERVRAQTMAMHSSEDVGKSVVKMFSELTALGVDEGTRFGIGILNHDNENNQLWTARKSGDEVNMHIGNIDMASHPLLKSARKAWKAQISFHKYVLEGEDLLNYYRMLNKAPDYKIQIPIEKLPKREVQHCFIFEHGFFYAFSPREFQPELIHITKRFSSLFEQTYRRYLDLVRAEAQAREAEIELALERVRARTMAMHHTEELKEVIQVVFDQFVGLNIHVEHAGFIIDYKEREDMHIWLADHQQGVPTEISIPYFDSPHWNSYLEAKSKGESFFVNLLPFEVKNKFYRDLFELIPDLTEAAQQAIFSKPGLAISTVLLDNVGLYIEHYSETPFSAEENAILMRFGKVFQQTYTRFLDLKKAESQAREAQIEAALEKVRNRSLAMHKSDELNEVVMELFERLNDLQIPVTAVGISINIEDSKDLDNYTCGLVESGIAINNYRLPYFDHRIANDFFEAREKQLDFFVGNYSKQEKDSFYEYVINHTELKNELTEDIKQFIFQSPSYSISVVTTKNTMITLNDFEGKSLSDDEIDILKRFAKVFEQTYTRFLDLQKAEAQAREAQIEAALERVRSRSLAMHKTSELQSVIHTVHQELLNLNISISGGSFIVINSEIDTELRCWGSGGTADTSDEVHIPRFEKPFYTHLLNRIKSGPGFFTEEYSREEKIEFFTFLFQQQPWSKLGEKEKKETLSAPGGYTRSCAVSKHTSIFIINHSGEKFSESENAILKRFGKVFEQSYTRFLDLQKAELQAKEARIEAALERVRSRSMAMHRTDELQEVVRVVAEELKNTGVILDTWGAVICTYFQDSKDVLHWTASEDPANPSIAFLLPYFKDELFDEAWESKERGDSYFAKVFSFEVKNAFFNQAFEHSDYRQLPDDYKKQILESETHGIAWAWAKNSAIMIPSIQGDLPSEDEKEILIRFAKVFEQSFIRFLDLQKAEAQAREAQIEAALERVRSRSMAMHKSEELAETASLLFKQIGDLGLNVWSSGFQIWNADDISTTAWMYTVGGEIQAGLRLPHTEDPYFINIYNARHNPDQFLVMESKGKELEDTYRYMFNIPEWKKAFGDIEASGFPIPKYQITHSVYFTHGYLMLITHESYPEYWDIFKRFGKVFEQTYTRFLDLQKAEAQAKEAQIEAALERVRSKTMAMHSSADVDITVITLFEELVKLGVDKSIRSGIGIFNPSGFVEVWTGSTNPSTGQTFLDKGILDLHPLLTAVKDAWEAKQSTYTYELAGDDLIRYFKAVNDAPDYSIQVDFEKLPENIIHYDFFFPDGFLFAFSPVPFSDETARLFSRFAAVFAQTYRRFLDLQKAEAQAREAKVEAALEKVRSRTMGMQSSEELPEVANLLFTEVRALGIHAWSCGYNILAEDKKSATCCMSSEGTLQTPFQLRLWGETSFDEMGEFVLSDHTMLVQELGDEALKEHYAYMKSFPDLKPTFDHIDALGLSLPTYQINHLCKFNSGFILFITYEKVPEAHAIFKRFTNVFDQTYTRFLDLQKAEAQAREAQIEAALEKVRSRSLAMQSPDELIEVAQLLREEMGALGVEELETSSIYIHDASSGLTECWFTIKNTANPDKAVTDQMTIKLEDTWVGRQMQEFFHSPAERTSIVMRGENRLEWIHYCEGKTNLFGTSNFYGETIPDRTYHLYKFSNGYIGAAAPGEISTESWELLKRATAVFSFAYTRFMDLQMAEASARTAMRQASLDRVRAEISSMRNADDLDRITPLFFHELTTLGVPFIRCGVFIIQEKQEIVEAYLSSPDGNSLGVLRLPYQASELTYQTVVAWRKRVIYRQHWNKEDFVQWINQLMEKDQIQDSSTYQGTAAPPESLHLHFVPFAQGMLYVGAEEPLDENELELVQALAKAFSIAYARYEDFVKLEQAKAEVESAMSELKSTQSQLVQQEKLASLGQLTAGIAHEIKNPLNFVNNFSEVSIELVDEAIEERNKNPEVRDETLVDEILIDIKSNLQKVHEHGSRANGIVTSMLQHSRGGSGKIEPTDLNALVKEYVNLSFHGMRAGKNPIDVELSFDLNPNVKEVPLIKEDFTRVIINLCNNAFDAMRMKTLGGLEEYQPKLTVHTKTEKNHILISFEDNGPGIPDEIKDKILQPFFTTKKGTEGTGLGLSITHDIVKAHGGELRVESKLGEGTTFIIELENKG